jgi:signal transduction histidine kinase
MLAFEGLTVRRKLTSISVLSSMTALVSASVVFLVYDATTFRERLQSRLGTEAQILGFNAVTPLLFNDSDAATSTLAGLQAEKAVTAAGIFRAGEGHPFAAYARDASSRAALSAPSADTEEARFADGHLTLQRAVSFEGKVIGHVVLRATLGELRARQRRYGFIVLVVLAASFLLAVGLSRIAERTISGPILALAAVASEVSTRKDYSVRAPGEGRDELGRLVRTFNQMLDEIQAQNRELEQARGELERRVEARTRDLAAANKELEAFSYSVSHDLRAPLRAIDGFSKVLLTTHAKSLDERGRHYLDRVRAATQRMSELIDDLLGLARVGRKELARREVDVSALAGKVAAELARRDADRAVRVEIAPGLSANADPQLLAIVLENLLGNAWKFTGKAAGACIEVGQEKNGQGHNGAGAPFYVKDNGAGFDMAYADKLFGAFQRLHLDSDFEGTGIGLVTVQRIVARHGGRIWAEGAVGKGATFRFTLEPNQ